MPCPPYHGFRTRPNGADRIAAGAKAKPGVRSGRLLLAVLLLAAPFFAAGKAVAQDNTAAYQALSRASLHNHHTDMMSPQDAKIHKVAKEFEGTFLTEMLRLARPEDKAASGFSAGESGKTWQVFMDQALGKAAAENGGTGLGKQIEDALRGKHKRNNSIHREAAR